MTVSQIDWGVYCSPRRLMMRRKRNDSALNRYEGSHPVIGPERFVTVSSEKELEHRNGARLHQPCRDGTRDADREQDRKVF